MKFCGDCGSATKEGNDETGAQHRFCPECGWRWYSPPTPVVLVLVTDSSGRVVYTHKPRFGPGRWSVVSGFVPRGERAELTAIREVREETGLEVELVAFLGTHVYESIPDQIVLAYHCRVLGGTLTAQDDIDDAELAAPDPARLREGSTSWLLVRSLIEPVPDVRRYELNTPVQAADLRQDAQ